MNRLATYVATVPPRSEIGCYAKFGKTSQISVVLNPQMSTGDLHMVLVAQFFSCQLHAVQHHTGCSLADGV